MFSKAGFSGSSCQHCSPMISALPKLQTKSDRACHHPPNLQSRAACSKIEGLLIRRSKRRQLFFKRQSLGIKAYQHSPHAISALRESEAKIIKKGLGTILQISKAARSKTEVCRHPSRVVSALQKLRMGLKMSEYYYYNQN